MPKLVVSREGAIVTSCFIEGARLTVGRSSQNDIRLDDAAVSKQHASVETLGNDVILRDLGSVNGTTVNGQQVSRHLLQHGDLIEITPFQIRYVDHKSVAAGDGDRTMVIQSPHVEHAPARSATTPAPTARFVTVRYPKGSVRRLAGAHAGESIVLDRLLVTFGEAGGPRAAVFRRPQGFFVASVEGSPPRVNGTPIAAGWQPLAHGDRIKVGGDELELNVEPE